MGSANQYISLGYDECSHSSTHRKRNAIHGSHERSNATATLEKRVWKRVGMPLPRNPWHSGQGTNTCFFVELANIPNDHHITYEKNSCDNKPHKKGNEQARLTVGGDRLDYSREVTTYTTDTTPFKILIHSTLSTEDSEMMMTDINTYYLGPPLPRYEYMGMLLSRFPEEIIDKYNLRAMAVDG
jgi:hypothetical protein